MRLTRAGLLAAGAALALPDAALARQPGDGYDTIPFTPQDAYPYYDPISELRARHVDRRIWPAVKRINQSGWVWTAESCQGGHRWSDDPEIRLVFRTADAGSVFAAVSASAVALRRYRRNAINATEVRVARVNCPTDWTDVRVSASPSGIAFFDRLAERLNGGTP